MVLGRKEDEVGTSTQVTLAFTPPIFYPFLDMNDDGGD